MNVGRKIVAALAASGVMLMSGCSTVGTEKSYPLHLYNDVKQLREDYSNERGTMLVDDVVLKKVSKDCIVADGFDDSENVMVAFPKGTEIVDVGTAIRVPYDVDSSGVEYYRTILFDKEDMGLGALMTTDEAERYGVVMNKNCWQLDEPVYLMVP